jgi:lathosterol oxidase
MVDTALNFLDDIVYDKVYPADWPRDFWPRQYMSIFLFVLIGSYLMVYSMATFSYFFIFDHSLKKHPKFLKDQVRREILYSASQIPMIAVCTTVAFVFEVRGHSMLYESISDYGWGYFLFSIPFFLFFTDCGIYWIHRWLHTFKFLYKHIHKPHHQWIVPTPFASHAFHWADGFSQSVPYHVFAFVFPLQKYLYIFLFIFVNIWTVSIHDSDYRVPKFLELFVNGAAHHTDHHYYFTNNFGQFFTLWDRIGGSYRKPSMVLDEKSRDPLRDRKEE